MNKGNIKIILLIFCVVGLFSTFYIVWKSVKTVEPYYHPELDKLEEVGEEVAPNSQLDEPQEDIVTTYNSKDGKYTMVVTQYSYISSDSLECKLAVEIHTAEDVMLPMSDFDSGIRDLPCYELYRDDQYPYPFKVRISDWGTKNNTFYVSFSEEVSDTYKVGYFEVDNGNVTAKTFDVDAPVAAYMPSHDYFITTSATVYDNTGKRIAQQLAKDVPRSYMTAQLLTDLNVLGVNNKVFGESTYTEYVYFFDPSLKDFVLVGQGEFEQQGVGCPIEPWKLEEETGLLGNFSCVDDNANVKIDMTFFD
jgi:hypothetical protein